MSKTRVDRPRYLTGLDVHQSFTSELLLALEQDGSFKANYLREVLLSKYVGPDTDPSDVRRDRAITKWLDQERVNYATTFRLLTESPVFTWGSWESIRDFARSLISEAIGQAPSFVELLSHGAFTNGASTRWPRSDGNVARKFSDQAHVSADCYEDLTTALQEFGFAYECVFPLLEDVVPSMNMMFTVPKSSVIDRVAAKEPDWNMYLQKSCGNILRRALKRKGIDLNDQSRNRSLARRGSIDGTLATLDLSSASDSITTQLVAELLPASWFVLLDQLRSKATLLPGEDRIVHQNWMFSSMGNGFTFELESLIFWALARSVARACKKRGTISVYGDDIICPSSVARAITTVFQFCGFKVNTEKSFWTGRFRESCGGHYYRGLDVTPFYIKEPVETTERLIHSLNRLRKWATTDNIDEDRYYHIWHKYATMVDRRLWGGWDCSSPNRLVSPGRSSWALKWVQKVDQGETERLQLGLYLERLHAFMSREGTASGESAALIRRKDGRFVTVRLPDLSHLYSERPKFLAEYGENDRTVAVTG